jgi:hypothetical protein
MDTRALDRLLRVFATIVGPAALGCGPGEGEGIDPSQFSADLCTESGWRMLDEVELADPVDYLELRTIDELGSVEMPQWGEPFVHDSTGEKCGGAADVEACLDAFAALPPESELKTYGGFDGGPSHRSLALTRADAVEAIGTIAGVRALLGSIDAPGDAALLATMDGHSLLCGPGDDVGEDVDGWLLLTQSGGGCGEGDDIYQHVVHVATDGTIEVVESVLVEKGDPGCAIGRMPAGLCRQRRPQGRALARPLGEFFAEVAELEAASITAFGRLAHELGLHGAPRSMIRGALRSREDEIRHARVTAAIARRFGGRPVRPRVAALPPRALVDVAMDNAAEGCIRETYGALVAHVQATEARTPALRRAMRAIARDETRHAALSWELSRWAEARMSARDRARVRAATRDALDRLEVELTRPMADEVHTIAGMPRADRARALFGGLRRTLFAHA